jgi:hypothetical protein
LGIAYAPGGSQRTVFRTGFGLYYNDLAQNGWVDAFTAVNQAITPCTTYDLKNSACLPSGEDGGQGALIDPHYHTPYALQASAGVEHDFGKNWRLGVPTSINRECISIAATNTLLDSRYQRSRPTFHCSARTTAPATTGLRCNCSTVFSNRFEVTANYVLASATTWGAVVGELFDYVNGVSNPLNAFGPGDHGPSGEDIRHRFVLIGTLQLPGRFEVSTLSQFESARPFTIATPADILNDGFSGNDRAVVNGVMTSLDQSRGTTVLSGGFAGEPQHCPRERVTLRPFAEFFNLFNRQNPGNNYVGDISALPSHVNSSDECDGVLPGWPSLYANSSYNQPQAIASPGGALGRFFRAGHNGGNSVRRAVGNQT